MMGYGFVNFIFKCTVLPLTLKGAFFQKVCENAPFRVRGKRTANYFKHVHSYISLLNLLSYLLSLHSNHIVVSIPSVVVQRHHQYLRATSQQSADGNQVCNCM